MFSARPRLPPPPPATGGATRPTTAVMASGAQAVTVPFLGHEVPALGLGLAALGRPGYINLGHDSDLSSKSVDDMRKHSWTVLDAAWAGGIRYFDAARSYGLSEDFLSSWLAERSIPTEDVRIGSKWGYRYTAKWKVDTGGEPHEVKEHTVEHLTSQAEETRARLGGHLNLYQIHSATLDSGVLDNSDVLDRLGALRADRGWRVGLTLSGTAQAETLSKALSITTPDGSLLFDCVQATWNLLEQSVGPALLDAHHAGLQVIVKEAVANGRLTARNYTPGFAPKLVELERIASEYDTTVDALALACVMVQPFAPMVLSGAATVQHVEANLAALQLARRVKPEDVEALMQHTRQAPGNYWSERGGLAWN